MSVKLFVGGLSFSTTSEGMRDAFARFGPVHSATVMTDRETGRSRGFGFVEMATPEEADKAISALNGSSLDGRMIRRQPGVGQGGGARGHIGRGVVVVAGPTARRPLLAPSAGQPPRPRREPTTPAHALR